LPGAGRTSSIVEFGWCRDARKPSKGRSPQPFCKVSPPPGASRTPTPNRRSPVDQKIILRPVHSTVVLLIRPRTRQPFLTHRALSRIPLLLLDFGAKGNSAAVAYQPLTRLSMLKIGDVHSAVFRYRISAHEHILLSGVDAMTDAVEILRLPGVIASLG